MISLKSFLQAAVEGVKTKFHQEGFHNTCLSWHALLKSTCEALDRQLSFAAPSLPVSAYTLYICTHQAKLISAGHGPQQLSSPNIFF